MNDENLSIEVIHLANTFSRALRALGYFEVTTLLRRKPDGTFEHCAVTSSVPRDAVAAALLRSLALTNQTDPEIHRLANDFEWSEPENLDADQKPS